MQKWPAQGNYNMLCLPYNHRQRHTMGYAFMNCVSVEAAKEFRARWHGISLVPDAKTKPLDILAAEVQGLRNNLMHMGGICKKLKSPDHAKYLPIVLDSDGSIIDFHKALDCLSIDEPFLDESGQYLEAINSVAKQERHCKQEVPEHVADVLRHVHSSADKPYECIVPKETIMEMMSPPVMGVKQPDVVYKKCD